MLSKISVENQKEINMVRGNEEEEKRYKKPTLEKIKQTKLTRALEKIRLRNENQM